MYRSASFARGRLRQLDTPTPSFSPWLAEHEADDRSTHGHRLLVGLLGLSLPPALYLGAALRTTPVLEHRLPLSSISAYYYTGASAIFVGVLAALSVFLVTYRGFGRPWPDRAVAIVAGVAAALVAVFPASTPHPTLALSWWVPGTEVTHFIAAATLLTMFAVFSLDLFRRGAKGQARSPGKRQRDGIHLACGLVIVGSMAAAAILGWADRSIFWPEALALEAFAVSWLVKGRLWHTAAATVERASFYAKNPRHLTGLLDDWRPD